MARGSDSTAAAFSLFSSKSYMQSWAAHNTYYASIIYEAGKDADTNPFLESRYRNFTPGNQYTQAAARSGVVNLGGYTYDPTTKAASTRASPNYLRTDYDLDAFGFRKKEKGDPTITWANWGPGFAWGAINVPKLPTPAEIRAGAMKGAFGPNDLSKFLTKLGGNFYTMMEFADWRKRVPTMLRYRNLGGGISDTTRSWKAELGFSLGPQKGHGGFGQSSVDSTRERYMTKETAAGQNLFDTDEKQQGKKFESAWAGWKDLSPHSRRQNYIPELGNMYKENTTETSDARRTKRSFF